MTNTSDPTENIRREMVAEINSTPVDPRAEMEAKYGQVWNTDELGRDFEVLSFLAPFVIVRRKSDKAKGCMMFQHSPRWYFDFQVTD